MKKLKGITFLLRLVFIGIIFLTLGLTSCDGGGSGGGFPSGGSDPATGSKWDQMCWDQGHWE